MPGGGLLALIVVSVIAGGIVGYSGFGFNLVSVPVLAMLIGPTEAIVLTLIVGAFVSALLTVRVRGLVDWSTTWILVAASLPGLAAGTVLVATLSSDLLNRVVGVIVVASALWLWTTRATARTSTEPDPRRGGLPLETGIGVLSGAMVASAAMSGPPIVWLFSWRRLPGLLARASTTAYVALVGVGAAAAISLTSAIDVTSLSLWTAVSAPSALIGLILGARLLHRFEHAYATVAVAILAFSGLSGVVLSLT